MAQSELKVSSIIFWPITVIFSRVTSGLLGYIPRKLRLASSLDKTKKITNLHIGNPKTKCRHPSQHRSLFSSPSSIPHQISKYQNPAYTGLVDVVQRAWGEPQATPRKFVAAAGWRDTSQLLRVLDNCLLPLWQIHPGDVHRVRHLKKKSPRVPPILVRFFSLINVVEFDFLEMSVLIPQCDWNFEINMRGQDIKMCKSLQLGITKLRNDERIPNLVSKFKSDNIWRHFRPKNLSKYLILPFLTFLTVFLAKRGQILFDLNSETRSGILLSIVLSFRNFLIPIRKKMQILIFGPS